MSVETILEDDLLGDGNGLLSASEEANEEDLLQLLDYDDDDNRSLTGSVADLLESESLGSLRELLQQSKPEKMSSNKPMETEALPKVTASNKRKKTVKLVRKRDPLTSDSSKATRDSSSEIITVHSGPPSSSSTIVCVKEESDVFVIDTEQDKSIDDVSKTNDIFVIDTEPDKSIDDVSDLREYLNRKKRKIFLNSEVLDSKSPQHEGSKTGRCSPLFPALTRGMVLDHGVLNTHSDSQQFTLHHLFQRQSPWQFSLDHL